VPATVIERPSRAIAKRGLNYCAECGRLSEENLRACADCGGEQFKRVPHVGTIYSYTTVRRSSGSFVLALVQLAEGRLVTGRVVGAGPELRIGLPVQFVRPEESGDDSGARGVSFGPHSEWNL